MIVRPRIKGFICTTAHPAGCAANVANAARSIAPLENGPRNALVVGTSTGYGLASRIVAAFGAGAGTLGVSLEKPPTERRTATAGWYNNVAVEESARQHGLYANTLDGDAFSDDMKSRVIDEIRRSMGQVDLLVYSLASPLRQHPRTGTVHRSVIKPLGETLRTKTLNQDRGIVHEVDIPPASDAETAATVAVMGGEDWGYWIESLLDANVLAPGFKTVAYTYIGSEISWPIYWHGTLGKAKEDLQRAADAIHERLGAALRGEARIAVLTAMVTQASSAIPSIPLYTALLFRVMKDASTHEDCTPHIDRLFRSALCADGSRQLDETGRFRMDDRELAEEIQAEVGRRWAAVTSENVAQLGDTEGIRADFLKLFGFGVDGVDYDADVDHTLGRAASS